MRPARASGRRGSAASRRRRTRTRGKKRARVRALARGRRGHTRLRRSHCARQLRQRLARPKRSGVFSTAQRVHGSTKGKRRAWRGRRAPRGPGSAVPVGRGHASPVSVFWTLAALNHAFRSSNGRRRGRTAPQMTHSASASGSGPARGVAPPPPRASAPAAPAAELSNTNRTGLVRTAGQLNLDWSNRDVRSKKLGQAARFGPTLRASPQLAAELRGGAAEAAPRGDGAAALDVGALHQKARLEQRRSAWQV